MVKKLKTSLVLPFSKIHLTDIPLVGGKNAALGEMFSGLKKRGVPVPDGFAVTVNAYWKFVDQAGIRKVIKKQLTGLDVNDNSALSAAGEAVRQAFLEAPIPKDVQRAILKSYADLNRRTLCVLHGASRRGVDVAVRSSATAEDLPGASFAGQQESYLHISGGDELLEAYRRCLASLFTNRAIAYRVINKFSHFKVALSVGVQQMVRSDIGESGVMFTIHTETGYKDAVVINSSYGLGETVVQGMVNPDQFTIHKPTLVLGYPSIIERRLGDKARKTIYFKQSGTNNDIKQTQLVKVEDKDRVKWTLKDHEVLTLAHWGVEIEKYFSKLHKKYTPMDIEWAKDGKTGDLYIVQARPETVASRKSLRSLSLFKLKTSAKPFLQGVAVGQRIGAGKAHVLISAKDMENFNQGEVLVARMTDPDWMPAMKKASAIVTQEGGRTCHAAIVSRELGLPCVVGVHNALKNIKTGDQITVSAADGEKGYVYRGILPFEERTQNIQRPKKLPCKIMLNIGNPDTAFEYSSLPVDGVGLARLEFILNEAVKVHPMACLNMQKISTSDRNKIINLSKAYKNPREFFIHVLAEGMAKIAAAFYPKQVIIRLSDFKTNEYANLIGGKMFEPKEDNPMIGWRGASRYYDKNYSPAFALECAAVKVAREVMGLKNIKIMIPFCRTVDEVKSVLLEMKKNNLARHKQDLDVYMMVEIPSNVILASEFAKYFDGFSIGSNDLTQLTLGVDRDSALVRHLYNERNPAVTALLSQVIASAKKSKIKIGICGQAPSDYPDFAKFLVKHKIDSMSLNPDSVMGVMKRISKK